MPVKRQWKTGEPPRGLTEHRVIVLGPDEIHDDMYGCVAKLMEDATCHLEHFRVVLIGTGRRYTTRRGPQVTYYGIDYLVGKWASANMLTQMYCHGYDSFGKAVKDVLASAGDDPHLIYFDDVGFGDDDAERFRDALAPHVRTHQQQVIRI